MKNRKLFAIAAVLIVLCLLFGACSSTDIKKQNAYQLVKGAVEKTGKLDSYQLDMNIKTITDILGTKMESPINFNIKTEGATGKSPKASGTMTMSVLGIKIDCDLYLENNTVYISMMGAKVKMDASSEEAKSYQFSDMEKGLLMALPEDILKDVQVVDNADGSRTVALKIDGEKFSQIYKELISTLSNEESYAQTIKDLKVNVDVQNAEVSITVLPSGYIGSYQLSFDMDVRMDSASENMDYEVSMGIEADAKFVDPGTKVTVTAPSDLSEYQDYSGLSQNLLGD